MIITYFMPDPLQYLLKEAKKRNMHPGMQDSSKELKNVYEWRIYHASSEEEFVNAFADILFINPPPFRPVTALFISVYATIPDPVAHQSLDAILADKKLTHRQIKKVFPFSSVEQWDIGIYTPIGDDFGEDSRELEYLVRFKQTPKGIVVAGTYYLFEADNPESIRALLQKPDNMLAERVEGWDKLEGDELLARIRRGAKYCEAMPMLVAYFEMQRKRMNEGEFDSERYVPDRVKEIAKEVELKRTPRHVKN